MSEVDESAESDYPTNVITRIDGIQAIIGECVICGEEHSHGLGARDPDRYNLGHRGAHCQPPDVDEGDASGGYYIELSDELRERVYGDQEDDS